MLMLSLVASTAFLGGVSYMHASSERGIPPWARKYNMNCSGCHYPAPPRLNATGLRFRWAGYRMPEDIGKDQEMDRVSNYLGTRARFQYVYEKPSGGPASTSEFSLPDVTVFYAGAYGRNFGGLLEVAKEEDETEFGAQVFGVWGGERNHGGFRVGQTHMLLNAGVAGFDRPVGINAPTPVAGPVTTAIPFSFAGDQAGLEAFYVTGSNRVSGQLFNGLGLGPDGTSRKKDFVLTDQFLLDGRGSGVIGTAYYGTVSGLDPGQEDLTSHFWRVGLSANKIMSDFEALGGVVFGKDLDLPVGGLSPFLTPTNRGLGYWFSGQYYFGGDKGPPLTLFARYEFVDPDTDTDEDASRRYVLGSVLPITLPEYLRLAAEYWLDNPQGAGAPKQNNIAAEVMLSF
ncbi:MAG: hypothetical protein ABIZ96_02985 [Gemmatimonadales bacterium]